MSNWSNPTVNSLYTAVLTELHDLIDKNATLLQDTVSDTNIPTNAKKWDTASDSFKKWNGATWDELAATYNINVSNLGGQIASYYLDAGNATGTLAAGIIDDTAHGVLGGLTLHAEATITDAGFMSAQDKIDLAAAENRTEAEVKTIVRTTLDEGIDSLVHTVNFDNGSSTVFDVTNSNIQKATYTAIQTISFVNKGTLAYTMQLYITTGNFAITLPTGLWEGGIAIAVDTGLCILTVHADGAGNYIYELLKDVK